jgi:hypothetical protein
MALRSIKDARLLPLPTAARSAPPSLPSLVECRRCQRLLSDLRCTRMSGAVVAMPLTLNE